jgi:hypothetical protein
MLHHPIQKTPVKTTFRDWCLYSSFVHVWNCLISSDWIADVRISNIFFWKVNLLSGELSTEPDGLAALAVADTQLRAHAGLEALLKGFLCYFIYRISEYEVIFMVPFFWVPIFSTPSSQFGSVRTVKNITSFFYPKVAKLPDSCCPWPSACGCWPWSCYATWQSLTVTLSLWLLTLKVLPDNRWPWPSACGCWPWSCTCRGPDPPHCTRTVPPPEGKRNLSFSRPSLKSEIEKQFRTSRNKFLRLIL